MKSRAFARAEIIIIIGTDLQWTRLVGRGDFVGNNIMKVSCGKLVQVQVLNYLLIVVSMPFMAKATVYAIAGLLLYVLSTDV